ncbi:hypothetical protein RSAG8_09636, partial [Rhizoctonia solani AG-8 WAC10335]
MALHMFPLFILWYPIVRLRQGSMTQLLQTSLHTAVRPGRIQGRLQLVNAFDGGA